MTIELRFRIFDGALVEFGWIFEDPFVIDGRGTNILDFYVLDLNIVEFFMKIELKAIHNKLGSINDGDVDFLFFFRESRLLVIALQCRISDGSISIEVLFLFFLVFGLFDVLYGLFLRGLLSRVYRFSQLENLLCFCC